MQSISDLTEILCEINRKYNKNYLLLKGCDCYYIEVSPCKKINIDMAEICVFASRPELFRETLLAFIDKFECRATQLKPKKICTKFTKCELEERCEAAKLPYIKYDKCDDKCDNKCDNKYEYKDTGCGCGKKDVKQKCCGECEHKCSCEGKEKKQKCCKSSKGCYALGEPLVPICQKLFIIKGKLIDITKITADANINIDARTCIKDINYIQVNNDKCFKKLLKKSCKVKLLKVVVAIAVQLPDVPGTAYKFLKALCERPEYVLSNNSGHFIIVTKNANKTFKKILQI